MYYGKALAVCGASLIAAVAVAGTPRNPIVIAQPQNLVERRISYADLKPYYDQVEPIFRVAGRNEGYKQLPDGVFLEDQSPWSGAMQRFIAGKTMPAEAERFSVTPMTR